MSDFLPHYLRALSFLVIGVAAYVFLARRLADLVQPLRLRLAREGERLLASGPDPADARYVRFWLDHAFSTAPAALFVLMFPVFMATMLTERVFGTKPKPIRAGPVMRRLSLLFMVSAFAANPLCGLVAAAELILFGVLTDPLILFRATIAVLGREAELSYGRRLHVS